MAPLPSNATPTFWLAYTAEGQRHELQFRLAAGAFDSDATTFATGVAGILKAVMSTTDSFLSLRRRAAGSQLSFPIAFTPVAGTASSAHDNGNEPAFLSITGRSQGGRRCRMTFFSPRYADIERYRITSSESGVLASFLDYVVTFTPNVVAVDGQDVIWNPYGNVGYNAYFQRKQRRSGS